MQLWSDPDTCEHRLAFGWACYSRWIKESRWSSPQWFRFTSGYDLWAWVSDQCRDKQQVWTYCHNVNFDWQITGMCQNLPRIGWECEQAIIEDPPNAFRWRKGRKSLRCLDSFNYFYAPLRDIGARLNLPKLTAKHAYDWEYLDDDYCRRDAEIVLVAIQQWIEWLRSNDLGGLAISLAAQSMRAYKHRFMDYPIYIDDNEQAIEMARASYVGGRTEAWTVGTPVHNITCLDVNSMYPHVMREGEFPTRLHGVYKSVQVHELARWLSEYALIAQVSLRTDQPVFPIRDSGKLIFPVGTFEATLCTPELAYALQHGLITSIARVAIYDKAPIFVSYIDTLFSLRLQAQQAGDKTADYYLKKLVNSHYGKWGQRGGKEEIIGHTNDLSLRVEDEYDLDTGQRYRVRYIAGVIMRRALDEESRESHPAICSHVTSAARMLLWRLACAAGLENVHYMDTDSLHVSTQGAASLSQYIDASRLGYLKVEKEIARAIYYGPKDYSLDGVRRTKGVRAAAIEVGRAEFEQQQWVSIRGACSLHWSGGPLVRRVRKKLKRVYTKGTVDANGRVLPFWRDD